VVKATGFLSTQKNAEQGGPDKDLDALDYTNSEIYTTIDLAGIICGFITYSGHGELELVEAESEHEKRDLASLLQELKDFTDQPSLSLITTNLLCNQNISFIHLKNNPNYLYINFFTAPLENTDFLKKIIKKSFSMVEKNMPSKIKIDLKKLLLRLAEKQPDVIQQQLQKFTILTLFVESISDGDMKNGGTDLMYSFEEATQAAEKGIVNLDYDVRSSALVLFYHALFKKDKGFVEATQAAEKAIFDPSSDVRKTALTLFQYLFKKNQGFAQAAQAAAKGIFDSNYQVQDEALGLFKVLFKLDQGFKEAIEAAAQGIMDPKASGRAFDLFQALFENNKGFAQAIQAVVQGIDSPDLIVRMLALDLFKVLLEKNQGLTESVQVAAKGIMDPETYVQDRAFDLFQALWGKNKGILEAIQAGTTLLDSVDQKIRDLSLRLFTALVRNDHAFKEATWAVKKGIVNQDVFVKNSALQLFIALVEKDQAFEEALEAAQKEMIVDHFYTRQSILSLFKQLIIKKPDVTKKVIQKILNEQNPNIDEWERSQLGALLKK